MALNKVWKNRSAGLYPQAGEMLLEWFARIDAWAAANPGDYTPVDAAALMDLEARARDAIAALGTTVKDFGAVGDGVTDDTAAIQAALDTGYAGFPAGIYLVGPLTFGSFTSLQGAGKEVTVLKARPGLNAPVLGTTDFANLTGTTSAGGPRDFAIRDLTVDGQKAVQTDAAARGIAIYGCGYELSNVVVRQCKGDGIYTEWYGQGELGAGTSEMEARYSGVRSLDNDGSGFKIRGPHDSVFSQCFAVRNGTPKTAANPEWGFWVLDRGFGAHFESCHAWGAYQGAMNLEKTSYASNCQLEMTHRTCLFIGANDCIVVGSHLYGFGNTDEFGLVIGDAAHLNIAGCLIDVKVTNCNGGAVNFAQDAGNTVRVRAYQKAPKVGDPNGITVLGTPHVNSSVDVSGSGTGSSAILQVRTLTGKTLVKGARSDMFGVQKADATEAFNVDTSGTVARVSVPNAANFKVYSDAYATEVFGINGSNGAFVTAAARHKFRHSSPSNTVLDTDVVGDASVRWSLRSDGTMFWYGSDGIEKLTVSTNGAITSTNARHKFNHSTQGNAVLDGQVTGDANPRFTVAAGGQVSWGNGVDVSDTLLKRVSANVLALGADDCIRTGLDVTTARPSASAVGRGSMFYDSTLLRPIWSDGTDWKDAAGTVV